MKAKYNKVTGEILSKIITLNKSGLTNKAISSQLNIHDETVRYHLKKNKLFSSFRAPIKTIENHMAICKKCGNTEPITSFQYGRKNTNKEYKLAYCNKCRKKQSYELLNSSVEKRLKDKFNRLKIRANNQNISFDLDFEYFLDLFNKQNGKCFYTDETMEWKVNNGLKSNSLSVDKINPQNGYIKGNIVFCCHRINTAKNSLTMEELKKWIPDWYARLQKLPSAT